MAKSSQMGKMEDTKRKVGAVRNIPSRHDGETSVDAGKEEKKIEIVQTKRRMLYGVNETPPWYLLILYAFQQAMGPLSFCMSVSIIFAEFLCAHDDENLKTRFICTTLTMSGLCTLVQCLLGIRIPVYQGPALSYVIPLIASSTTKEWSCNTESNDLIFTTLSPNETSNATSLGDRHEVVMMKLRMMSGSLMLAGTIHALIGCTGMVGLLVRYIGPITVVPTITLAGLYAYKMVVRFCETRWDITMVTFLVGITLFLYLGKKITPIPFWNREKGFHISYYPFHSTFAVLICIVFGWTLCAILTAADVISGDPKSREFYARTDSRSHVISTFSWFYFPYPGQYGLPSFSVGMFANFLVATFISIVDSIGDYYACANISEIPPPPQHAVNRGIFVEGLCSVLSGVVGTGHATTTYGSNIGNIGITRVASRRVFQLVGVIYITFGILGKVGATFITIPYPVLGAIQIISFGIFIGVVLSNLQYVDLHSTRNTAIVGISILIGLMVPYHIESNPGAMDTGIGQLTDSLRMIFGIPTFVGGVLSCLMDNTIPGTLSERGLTAWLGSTKDSAQLKENVGQQNPLAVDEAYGFPFLPEKVKKSWMFQILPFLPSYALQPEDLSKDDPGENKDRVNDSVSFIHVNDEVDIKYKVK